MSPFNTQKAGKYLSRILVPIQDTRKDAKRAVAFTWATGKLQINVKKGDTFPTTKSYANSDTHPRLQGYLGKSSTEASPTPLLFLHRGATLVLLAPVRLDCVIGSLLTIFHDALFACVNVEKLNQRPTDTQNEKSSPTKASL